VNLKIELGESKDFFYKAPSPVNTEGFYNRQEFRRPVIQLTQEYNSCCQFTKTMILL